MGITRRLTITYVTALALLGLLSLISNRILDSEVEQSRGDATVINMSGKQRMLSQRVSLTANLFIQFGGQASRDALTSIANEMLTDHFALIEGDPERGVMNPASPTARMYYFQDPHNLDERVRVFVQNAVDLAQIEDSRSDAAVALAAKINAEARGPLLDSLDEAVSNFEREAIGKIIADTRLNNLILAIQVVVIVAIAMLIFRPMVSLINKDLKDRRTRERDLELMSWVVENMDDAMILTGTDGKILACNRGAEVLTGFDRDELLGKDVLDLAVHETLQDRTEMRTEARQKLEDGGVYQAQFEITRKDGSIRVFDNRTTALRDDSGSMIGRISINRDVTDRYEVDRMKNEFVSVVSHELRTPLTSIMGSLGIIQSGAVGTVDDEIAAMIDIAYNNSDRLVRLINDILDIEKIEAGRMDFRIESLNVRPLVEQAVVSDLGYAQKHGIKIEASFPDGADLWVKADKDKINQVFANLLSNAIKFSPDGGIVDLKVIDDTNVVRFEIVDRGEGVPLEFQDQLFQKFSQADSSATRKVSGTGLGLTISQALAERMGGTIGFDSEPGNGATFYFTMPKAPSTVSAIAPVSGKRRALIIEDDADTALLLRMILEQIGLTADITYSVSGAQQQLDSTDYDVITLDLDLNGQSGLELLYSLGTTPESPPVVVVSGHVSGDSETFNGGLVDMAGWIQKPVEPSLLQEVVNRALRSKTGKPHILHVEDDADIVAVVAGMLKQQADVTAVSSLAEARSLLADMSPLFDLVLLDLDLPDGRGEDILTDLKNGDGQFIPVIVFSGHDLDPKDIATNVTEVLQKTRTPNDELVARIMRVLERSATPETDHSMSERRP